MPKKIDKCGGPGTRIDFQTTISNNFDLAEAPTCVSELSLTQYLSRQAVPQDLL
jgi:hypothetical protein